MSDDGTDGGADLGVLRHKRGATRYRILVEIAERQPAVSQREIADAIGITAQAVSEHLGDLAEGGFVDREGRGRYRVTKEGVDWLISRTDELSEYLDHVTSDVLGDVEVETALADGPIEEGDRVGLSMRDGVLHARSVAEGDGDADDTDDAGGATAVAVTSADSGRDVGVAEFDGVVDYELGAVTAVAVPAVRDGGSGAVDPARLRELVSDADLVVAAGTEAMAALGRLDREPDVRFGTADAVREAAMRGLDVVLVVVAGQLSAHAEGLRETAVGYEVVDASHET